MIIDRVGVVGVGWGSRSFQYASVKVGWGRRWNFWRVVRFGGAQARGVIGTFFWIKKVRASADVSLQVCGVPIRLVGGAGLYDSHHLSSP